MAKKKSEEKEYPTIIHIKAESKYISVNGLFPEKKAELVLVDIRNNFCKMAERFDTKGEERLIVQTCVHNPKLL